MKKIEDYKDQKVAIHCSTKEEWDKIVDLLPSNRSVKKIYWQNSVNNGKSDTITIKGYGWSPKKHYEDEGYTIYPASDFLEEESVNSLIENEIYYNLSSNNIVRWKNPAGGNYLGNGCTIYNSDYGGNFHNNVKQYRLATPEEKHWFLECEKADRFIPYDEAMKTFSKQNPFKFNIGDEIKSKPGGYYISDPKFFAESHKKQFPSEKSGILGKITERTQAQGFNWYKCGYGGNWITEEGVELVKEDIPEHDECINTSKSLIGRYLKALVDYPNAGSVLKGEIGIITKEYNGIPLQVDFPSQKYYNINDITYKNGESYELMPEGFKPEDDLISEAKKRYPIGTKFRPAHIPGSDITEYCIVTEDSIFHKNGDEIVLTINGRWWIEKGNPKYGNTDYNRYVYYQGKWAEIVSDEPEINTYGLKVGDILKEEIINAWAYIEGNFCPNVQKGWVDVFCSYGGDRKIEDFRDIDGQIGFHVSGCTEGTHYLKAEGFKEFADNFYKKEEEGMLKMLPYPKDNYFKAVVVKDIHKKDIVTKGNMPDLIPKGYQTWFIDKNAYYRERISQSEYLVCPENNRWKANIPPEYFQIVEDEKHNDIAEKEWIPKVGEYIVYNNTDVLKITKIEPCKSHRYWITHIPNSFSGGGFGWLPWAHKIRKARLEDMYTYSEGVSSCIYNPSTGRDKVEEKEGKNVFVSLKSKELTPLVKIKNRTKVELPSIPKRKRLEIKPIKQTIKLKHHV